MEQLGISREVGAHSLFKSLRSEADLKCRILAGALPKNAEIVSALLKEGDLCLSYYSQPAIGMSTFVCMVTDDELKRQGKNYFEIAKSLVFEHAKEFPKVSLKKLQYIHVPIYGKKSQCKIIAEYF